jgi:hypothetical protein
MFVPRALDQPRPRFTIHATLVAGKLLQAVPGICTGSQSDSSKTRQKHSDCQLLL